MNKMITCFSVEGKKLFSSKIPLVTMLALTIVPFMAGFFMFVLKDPSLAEELGFISYKSEFLGTSDWPSYFSLLAQAISIGGLLVFGFVTSWIFGSEYSERTYKDLLALPISRTTIVLSKFIVAALWCFVLSIFTLALGLIIGKLIDMPGWSYEIIIKGFSIYLVCSTLTLLLSTPIAFFASFGRGYLSPLGFMILTVVLSQIVAVAGYGEFFPWAIPALVSGVAGSGNAMIGEISIILVILTSVIGLVGTMLWWKYADQN